MNPITYGLATFAFAGRPSLLGLVVVFAIGLLALYGLKALMQNSPGAIVKGFFGLLVVLGVLALFISNQRAQIAQVAAVEAKAVAAAETERSLRKASVDNASELDQWWEELHRVKIDLTDETGADAAEVESSGDQKDGEPERPDWVDAPAKRVGSVYRKKLKAGPWPELSDCYRELEEKLRVATAQRIELLAGGVVGESHVVMPSLQRMGVGMDYVIRELCAEEYVETVQSESFEEMKNVHVLMEITPEDDARLLQHWVDYSRRHRLAAVSVGAGSILGVLALAYGLLSLDTWTRGYYSKRLLLGVPAAIIIIAVLLLS